MSDSTDSNGSVIFVAEQHIVKVQVHQNAGDPTVIPETQQQEPPTTNNNTEEPVVIPETQDDNPRQNTGNLLILLV